jgi:hypothetical protein
MIRTIYCDMDQVLVNFLGGARKALGKEFNDPAFETDKEKWRLISQVPDFWLQLQWMPNAINLWTRIKPFDSHILTACPTVEDSPNAPAQKRLWCAINLGVNSACVHTVQRVQKQDFATPESLLIDDHPKNVSEWRNRGGIAIQHSTVPETLNQLDQLGL